MSFTIRTNNVPRFVIYGYDLTVKEQAELSYLNFADDAPERDDEGRADGNFQAFFRYKGNVYAIGECMRLPPESEEAKMGWHGYYGESYFSAVLVKLSSDGESVIVGQHFS